MALLEPFIDTLIVCTMTGLVIVITGAYDHPDAGEGIAMTSWAFATSLRLVPLPAVSFTAVLFAFSTMISWSYYGEQCWAYLFGGESNCSMVYKRLFLLFVMSGLGASRLSAVIDFGDMMILGMAFPNIFGVVLLSGRIKKAARPSTWRSSAPASSSEWPERPARTRRMNRERGVRLKSPIPPRPCVTDGEQHASGATAEAAANLLPSHRRFPCNRAPWTSPCRRR